MPEQEPVKFAVAWYRRDQWPKLLAASVDDDDLEDTFEEWEAVAEKRIRDLKATGKEVEKVEIDIDLLMRWCQEKKIPLNASARAQFAAKMARDGA